MSRILGWEVSAGFYPGILLGFRSYTNNGDKVNHVLYVPFMDICLTFHVESNG